MNKKIILKIISILAVCILYGFFHSFFPSPNIVPVNTVHNDTVAVLSNENNTVLVPQDDVSNSLGVRSKSANCSFDYLPLPDPDCTTGAIFPNATKDVICISGYSASVRDVPESLKNQVYAEYNVVRVPYEAEVDHCVSLEIGGSNDISNLWIEKYNMTLGARVKDKVENCLHRMVCDGTISLQQAQYDVCHNWTKYLKENGGTC